MKSVPSGETARERRNQWYVGAVAVIALLSLIGNVFLTFDNIRTDNASRNALTQRDDRIIQLEQQHSADIQNESQLLQGLQNLDNGVIIPYVKNLDDALNAICAKSGAGCSISFAPTTTTTTTTTVPPVSHSTSSGATPHSAPAATPAVTPTTAHHPGHSGSAPGHNKHH